jgi:hypothetical protein
MAMLMNPALGYNFLITFVDSSSALATTVSAIQHVALGGFSECSGLETSQKIEEYNEGGRNSEVLKFPGRVSWNNIVSLASRIKHRSRTGFTALSWRGKTPRWRDVLQNDCIRP